MHDRSSILAAAFGTGLLVAACTIGEQDPPGSCDPTSDDPCPSERDTQYICCSDDPAALDLTALDSPALPAYEGHAGPGWPLFSGGHNGASRWGTCIQVGSVPPSLALVEDEAQGCPTPCNPSWAPADVETVCGDGTLCCQTNEIEATDCVFDPTLGDAGCHRPARGEDIVGFGGLELSDWAAGTHATEQDAGMVGCQAFVAGLSDQQLAGNDPAEVLHACVRRLSVADQRGFCLGGAGVSGCPLAQPSYRDACETLNDEQGLAGCD